MCKSRKTWKKRAANTPLRLTYDERCLMGIEENSGSCSNLYSSSLSFNFTNEDDK
jgi:hypothetical protein